MTEVNYTRLNINIPEIVRQQSLVHTHAPSFLNLTGQYSSVTPSGIIRKSASDVISGDVQDEINQISQETDIINSVIGANANELSEITMGSHSYFSTDKVIEFEEYTPTVNPEFGTVLSSGHSVAQTTNTNKLMAHLQYSPNYNLGVQQTIVQGAVTKLVNWLDDMIVNYDANVAIGTSRGDSESKLSFLLRLRKQIENCDFPVGFGNDEYFAEASTGDSVVLGCYQYNYYDMYLNPTDDVHDNEGIVNNFNRSILLNAAAFIPNRRFTNEAQLRAALDAYAEVLATNPNPPEPTFTYGDIIMASDEFYQNFAETYLASVLAHEFIHATHIGDEAVTYNTCEMIEDDFRNRVVFNGWDPATQASIDNVYVNFNLNSITYDESYIPLGSNGGLGFHDLGTYEDVAYHGWTENTSYDWYNQYTNGTSFQDNYKELLNFIV